MGRRIAFRAKERYSKSHLENVGLSIMPVSLGLSRSGVVWDVTGQIPGALPLTVTYGSPLTWELETDSCSWRTICDVYKQEVVYQIRMNHGVRNVG